MPQIKICQYCQSNQKLNSSTTSITKSDYPNEYLPPIDAKVKRPLEYSQIINFVIRPNSKIWYFGAKPINLIKDTKSSKKTIIIDYSEAYNDYSNSGIAESDKEGNVEVYLDCPNTYRGLDGKIYYKHFHYIYLNKKNKKWSKTIQTKLIFCQAKKSIIEKIIKNKLPIPLFNALPWSVKYNIPGSLRLTYNLKLSGIMDMIKEYEEDHGIKIDKNLPVIVYCYNPECDAGEKLIEKLLKLGFTNIFEYKGGVEEWFQIKN